MSAWTDLGLPAAEFSDYQYNVDAGLLRTPFETAQPRQTRTYTKNKRTFSFHVKLTRALAKEAEQYLTPQGYDRFPLPLLSGYDTEEIVNLCVRLVQDPMVTAEGHDTYKLQMVVEQLDQDCEE